MHGSSYRRHDTLLSIKPAFAGTQAPTGSFSQVTTSRYLILLLFVAALFAPLCAQNPRGALRGVVQDASGARIAAAEIKIHESSLTRKTVTDNRGEFRLDDLLPGNYHLTVSAKGFAEAQLRHHHRDQFCARRHRHHEAATATGNGECPGRGFLHYYPTD